MKCYTSFNTTTGTCDGAGGGVPASAHSYAEPTADGSIGVLVPAYEAGTLRAAASFAARDANAFCAVGGAAVNLLHELVHVCISRRDGESESTIGTSKDFGVGGGCWQEARMTGFTFQWAMAQRFPCMAFLGPCGDLDHEGLFMLTTGRREITNTWGGFWNF
jgi:hypothetical protein